MESFHGQIIGTNYWNGRRSLSLSDPKTGTPARHLPITAAVWPICMSSGFLTCSGEHKRRQGLPVVSHSRRGRSWCRRPTSVIWSTVSSSCSSRRCAVPARHSSLMEAPRRRFYFTPPVVVTGHVGGPLQVRLVLTRQQTLEQLVDWREKRRSRCLILDSRKVLAADSTGGADAGRDACATRER